MVLIAILFVSVCLSLVKQMGKAWRHMTGHEMAVRKNGLYIHTAIDIHTAIGNIATYS